MSECLHEHIQTWRDMETGQAVGLWSCSKCNRKFAPLELSARDSEVERLREALEHIVRRLQMDIDDGGRPDQWSMEDLVRKANSALSCRGDGDANR